MKENDFYGESLANEYVVIRKWVFNRRFPFIHRQVIRKKVSEWQKMVNKRWNDTLDLYESRL